jgi:hypothetical protein
MGSPPLSPAGGRSGGVRVPRQLGCGTDGRPQAAFLSSLARDELDCRVDSVGEQEGGRIEHWLGGPVTISRPTVHCAIEQLAACGIGALAVAAA